MRELRIEWRQRRERLVGLFERMGGNKAQVGKQRAVNGGRDEHGDQ